MYVEGIDKHCQERNHLLITTHIFSFSVSLSFTHTPADMPGYLFTNCVCSPRLLGQQQPYCWKTLFLLQVENKSLGMRLQKQTDEELERKLAERSMSTQHMDWFFWEPFQKVWQRSGTFILHWSVLSSTCLPLNWTNDFLSQVTLILPALHGNLISAINSPVLVLFTLKTRNRSASALGTKLDFVGQRMKHKHNCAHQRDSLRPYK